MKHSAFTGRRRGGFTLVELLVVIGIIVVLFSIATPMVLTARRNADRVRTQSDLNAIAQALDAYKNDFKDYPRPDPTRATDPVLAWALLGPWPAVSASSTTPGDGADGPGFRTHWDKDAKAGSRVWGPYLPPDKFPTENVDGVQDMRYLVDRFGTRIEYLPRWGSPKPGRTLFGTTGTQGVYDYRQIAPKRSDDPEDPVPKVLYYFQRALGDGVADPYTHNDLIDPPNEKLLADPPPFLLLSRGHRKTFSTKDEVDKTFAKTSEVTNLQTP
jgi:general secretion pathway protein G